MTASINVLDIKGKKVSDITIAEEIMAFKVNQATVHQVVVAYLNGLRQGTASTKTRGEVSGGGAKPWRQKGTGRARAGSNRSPIWRHGGITHGPQPRDFATKVPKKMKYAALKGSLTEKMRDDQMKIIDKLPWQAPSTKAAVDLLTALKAEGKVLAVVMDERDEVIKSFQNLPQVKIVSAGQLTTYDVLNCDDVVTTEEIFNIMVKERLA